MIKTSVTVVQSTINLFLAWLYHFMFGKKISEKKKMLSKIIFLTAGLLFVFFVFVVYYHATDNLRQGFVHTFFHYERASIMTIFVGYIGFVFVGNLIFFRSYRKAVSGAEWQAWEKYRPTIIRIMAVYMGDFLLGILFLLPSLTGYALHVEVTVAYCVFCVFSLFALPLFMSALSGVMISLLEMLCTKFSKLPKLITVVATVFSVVEIVVMGLLNFWITHFVATQRIDIGFLHNRIQVTRPFCFYADILYTEIYENVSVSIMKQNFINMWYFVLTALLMVMVAVFLMIVFDGIARMTKADLHTVVQILKISLQAMVFSTLSFISGKSNLKKLNHSAFGTVIIIVMIFFVLALLSFFFGVFAVVAIVVSGNADIYFFAVFAGAVIFSLMGSIFASQSYLFEAKDNELLLSMPVSPTVMLLSRTFTLYSLNFIYSMMVMLPSFLVYITFVGTSLIGILFYLVSLFIVPVLITALGCLIGYVLWKIASKVPKKNAFSTIFGMVMLFGIAFVWLFIDRSSMTLAEFVAWVQFLTENYLLPIHWYGLAISTGSLFYMTLFVICCSVVLIPVVMFISERFIHIITAKENIRKKAYVRKSLKQHSMFVALLRKEIVYFFKLPGYVLNSGMGSIMMVIMGIFLLCQGINVPEDVYEYLPNFDDVLKISIVSAVSLMAVMNDVSAPSISLEGKTLWILRSAPVDCMTVFLAKALVAPIITLPGIIFLTVISAIQFSVSWTDIIFIFVIPTLASFFSGILGVLINLRFPRFDWSAEIIVIKQSGSVLLSILGSIFITGLPFIFAIIFPALLPDFNLWISYMICLVYLSAVTLACCLILKCKGKTLYENL